MRINKFLAFATGQSRRSIDVLINAGRVQVNGKIALLGQNVSDSDIVILNNKRLQLQPITTIMLNKPTGYVCSRNGQGSQTIYSLLPKQYHHLKPVGRLDKDSSGLLLLTNDGKLAHKLTHPSFKKDKLYIVGLKPSLTKDDQKKIKKGIELKDGLSKLDIQPVDDQWQITMHEGRNRQIRRTFEAIGYRVTSLNRIEFGVYKLANLKIGDFDILTN